MIRGESLVEDVPELLACFGALGTPPEPGAFGFVQWAPEDGDAGVLEFLELHGDGVNIVHEEGVVGIGGVLEGGREVEICGCCVEAAPPALGFVVVEADGGTPVPDEGYDAAFLGEGECVVDV